MQNFWYAISALYMIALAFTSGSLVAHVVVGSSGRSATLSNSDVLTALGECLALVAIGVFGVLGKRRWQRNHLAAVADDEGEALADAPTDAVVVPSSYAVSEAATLAEAALGRAESAIGETPIESLLALSVEESLSDSSNRLAYGADASPSQPAESHVTVEPLDDLQFVSATAESDVAFSLGNDSVVEPLPAVEPVAAEPTEEPVPVPKVIAEDRVSLTPLEESISAESVSLASLSFEPAPQSSVPPVSLPERPSLTIVPPSSSQVERITPPVRPESSTVQRPVAEPTATAISSRAGTASILNEQRPRPVRTGYLFAPKIIWGNSRSLLIRAWVIAALTAIASVAVLFMLRDRASIAQLSVLAAIVVAATLGPLAHTLVVTAASRRFGRTWVHLGTSPAAPRREVSGTVWVSNQRLRHAVRSRQLIRPASVRLACVRPTGAASRKAPDSSEVWHHEVAVRADRMTFMTGRLGIPFRFDLPQTVDHIRPDDQSSLAWVLSVDTTMNGLELAEQFVLPLEPPEPTPLEATVERRESNDPPGFGRTPPLRQAR